jgi:hypothetical protein
MCIYFRAGWKFGVHLFGWLEMKFLENLAGKFIWNAFILGLGLGMKFIGKFGWKILECIYFRAGLEFENLEWIYFDWLEIYLENFGWWKLKFWNAFILGLVGI